MKVDKRIVEPFNAWWRKTNHCEPDLKAIEAFDAGFKAGLQYGIDKATEVLMATPVKAAGR